MSINKNTDNKTKIVRKIINDHKPQDMKEEDRWPLGTRRGTQYQNLKVCETLNAHFVGIWSSWC